MKKMLFIMNPYAGMRKGVKYLADIIAVFNRAGYEVNTYMTAFPGDGVHVVEEQAGQVDLVVCAGGDGTLSETVTGLMSLPHPPLLGYIPFGSTNDCAVNLNLPKVPTQAALIAAQGIFEYLEGGR